MNLEHDDRSNLAPIEEENPDMTEKNAPTTPETLDTEQLDAAVGGIIAIVPCVKIAAVAIADPCVKTVKTVLISGR